MNSLYDMLDKVNSVVKPEAPSAELPVVDQGKHASLALDWASRQHVRPPEPAAPERVTAMPVAN